jgi:flagellar M-ring protein FliF
MNERFMEFWNQRSTAARVGIAIGALAILSVAIAATVWALRTEYQPLFTELDARDASAIAAELDRLKIPYQIAEDGTTILVDKSNVHAARMKVMGKGLDLKGTVGFEIFNNTDFGMTEFAQRINYQRALQGELARTISALNEVRNVRVHLVLPESSVLRKSTVLPKASVTLVTRSGERLMPEQIQGIQRLVAASVPEMEPAAVTVLDQQGIALSRRSDPQTDLETGPAGLDAKRDVENYMTHKVIAVLDQAFGPGKAVVTVDVTLSHDHIKMTREDVVPSGRDAAILRRKDTTQRTPISVAGPDGVRDPSFAPSAAASEVEYLHGRHIEQIVSEPGAVKRVSVGVLLPRNVDAYQAERLKQVIANTVGLNPSRGDSIAVSWIGSNDNSVDSGTNVRLPKESPSRKPTPEHVDATARLTPMLWVALFTTLIVLSGAVYSIRRRGARRTQAASLSPQEREELLARVKHWLAADGSVRQGAP